MRPHTVPRAQELIGPASLSSLQSNRSEWWQALRKAETPEDRLLAQRMIDVLGEAIGLQQFELGQEWCAKNIAEATRKAAAEREARALARWTY